MNDNFRKIGSGIKDIFGVEIFDGDICLWNHLYGKCISKVTFIDGAFWLSSRLVSRFGVEPSDHITVKYQLLGEKHKWQDMGHHGESDLNLIVVDTPPYVDLIELHASLSKYGVR